MTELICRDFGHDPNCQEKADPRYTMYPPASMPDAEPLHWCASCGPSRVEISNLIIEMCVAGGPDMVKLLDELITKAEQKAAANRS